MKVFIQYQDQFGHWRHYSMKHHEPDAFRTAQHRAKMTKKRHRLVDEKNNLLDILEPEAKLGFSCYNWCCYP